MNIEMVNEVAKALVQEMNDCGCDVTYEQVRSMIDVHDVEDTIKESRWMGWSDSWEGPPYLVYCTQKVDTEDPFAPVSKVYKQIRIEVSNDG